MAWLKGRETDVMKNRMCVKLKEDAFQEKAGSWDGSSQLLDVFWQGAFEPGTTEDNFGKRVLTLSMLKLRWREVSMRTKRH